MTSKNYYTVREMTDKVNELLGTLERAKEMAYELRCQNVKNSAALNKSIDEAKAEQRPLTWEQRKAESAKYVDLFAAIENQINDAIDSIGLNY